MLTDRNITLRRDRLQRAGATGETGMYDDYTARLIKLVPAELIAFYLALDGIASSLPGRSFLPWIIFGLALAGGWFYLARQANVAKIPQRILTLLAFAIWVYMLGGPFDQFPWYNVSYGKLLVALYTFFVPLFYR